MVQLSVSDSEQREFEEIASELGFVWGDRGSQTALYKAIAHRQVDVVKPQELDNPQAKKLLELISHKIPFRIAYSDAAGKPFTFTARYAERVKRDSQYYLECWCDETENNQDIEPLRHNWCLRFDRVASSENSILPLDPSTWREEGMDSISVQFELHGGLAHAYRLRPNDCEDHWDGVTRKVTRKVTATFWFIREIVRYTKDCKVLSPDLVRDKVREHFQAAIANYLN